MNVLLNGQLKDRNEAVISVFDHGFLYGMGLFETFRTYGGEPWLLDRHAARLSEGCRTLGIAYQPDIPRMRAGIASLLKMNGLGDAYIRWSISAGEGAVGLPSGTYETPGEVVYAKDLPADHPETRAGQSLRLLRVRRNAPEGAIRLKSFHFMNNILAKRELTAAGASAATEGLFLDGRGHICEGIVSNVFWFAGGGLHTPSLEAGPLPGITRQFVLELAGSAGWPVREGCFQWADLMAADEVFLTGSVQEIVPVTGLEDQDGRLVRRFDSDRAGSRTRELMRRYRECAEGGKCGETYFL
ncbi:MAG: pabC [Cohnella sp.]|nr:pabC [Cohnella sp.]